MGKKYSKKKLAERKRATMRAGVLALLCTLGVALLGGMALFNRGVKPDRDMQWYVREGALQVAAPALGEASAEEQNSEFLLPEEGVRVTPEPTPEPTPTPEPEPAGEEVASGPVAGPFAQENEGAAAEPAAGPYAPEQGFETDEDVDAPADAAENPEEAGSAGAVEEAEEEAPVGQVTLTVTAAGDCTFGGMIGAKSYVRFLDYVGKYGYNYFFDGVRDIFEADDLTIINLEGPLTTEEKPKSHGFVFKADPSCVQILTGSSVEVCNLANNHSRDYGMNGLKQTAQVLDDNGIGFCGYNVAYQKTIKGVRVCVLGFTKWDNSNEQIVKAVTAAREQCDLLIVNMHWGWEHTNQHCTEQSVTGHAIIDAGADLVIGTHPHVIQGIEKYKDKYIVYSLGNFCFAGNADPEDKRCILFQQKFSFVVGMNLSRAGCADAGINIIPATVSSTNAMNDFQPTVLPAEQGAAVLKALAGYSVNFKVKDTLWMKDNYLLANGLIKPKGAQDDEGEASAEDADAEPTGKGADADELPPTGDEPPAGDETPAEDGASSEDGAPAGAASLDTGDNVSSGDGAGIGLSNAPAADFSLDEVDLDEPEPFFSMGGGAA